MSDAGDAYEADERPLREGNMGMGCDGEEDESGPRVALESTLIRGIVILGTEKEAAKLCPARVRCPIKRQSGSDISTTS